MKSNALLLVAAVVAGFMSAAPAGAQSVNEQSPVANPTLSPPELLKQLRAGGYTLHFRHAATDSSTDDARAADTDCSKQRNLSNEGREQARRIGDAIRTLGIPIGAVLAGPLCRTMETARLMFGRAQSEPDVRGGGLGRPDYSGLRRLISTPVPAASNQAIVGHGHQFQFVSGLDRELAEGEGAVIKGAGNGKFEIIARIRGEDWDKLKSAALSAPAGKS